jgi:general secretion pathway protein E
MEELVQNATAPVGSISSSPVITGSSPLCELLVSDGHITPEEIMRSIELQTESGVAFGVLLVRLGLVSDRDMADLQCRITDFPLLDEKEIPEIPILTDSFSAKFLQDAYILPIDETEEHLIIAMVDPGDEFTIQAIELASHKPVQIKIATTTQIENALGRLYGDGNSRLADIVEEIENEDDETFSESIERLKDLAGEAPIIRLVSLMINRAIELRASDIHIEPFENCLKVRYRIDGVLQEAEAPPVKSTAAIISRVKIMAKLNIAEHRLPQDGRIQLRTQGKLIDLRVSTVPTLHGESLVLRILDKQHIELNFDKLGFATDIKEKLQGILKLSHGIVLVTGPTGSGKTTTLYTALRELNTPDKKILTVEDPVEYQLEGINQIQVKPQIGLNFSDALRSIVRQDPDIIMIGEMRDLETASIAVQSALTGHLVFSTLHTNDAGSSITRLLDMGVEDYLLTSTLNNILSQRLVRTLCTNCREAYTPLPELIEELNLNRYTDSDELTLHRATGCDQCKDNGYIGRSVITELLTLSEPIRRLILSHADGTSIQNNAVESGMDTMQVDGIKKALLGITTIEDVMRVTQQI